MPFPTNNIFFRDNLRFTKYLLTFSELLSSGFKTFRSSIGKVGDDVTEHCLSLVYDLYRSSLRNSCIIMTDSNSIITATLENDESTIHLSHGVLGFWGFGFLEVFDHRNLISRYFKLK